MNWNYYPLDSEFILRLPLATCRLRQAGRMRHRNHSQVEEWRRPTRYAKMRARGSKHWNRLQGYGEAPTNKIMWEVAFEDVTFHGYAKDIPTAKRMAENRYRAALRAELQRMGKS